MNSSNAIYQKFLQSLDFRWHILLQFYRKFVPGIFGLDVLANHIKGSPFGGKYLWDEFIYAVISYLKKV